MILSMSENRMCMQRLAELYGVFLGGLKTNRARDLAQARGGSVRDSVVSGVSLRARPPALYVVVSGGMWWWCECGGVFWGLDWEG